ncbi:MAG: S-layer homology domain-containing protein [Firmicutes bacterium]|nr:S-layer homology domain-containing protein [Bacillota bacterium]
MTSGIWYACNKVATDIEQKLSDEAAIENENNEVSEVQIFWDVEGTWAEEAVMYLAKKGIVSGIGDNMFGAENNITRAEFVTMLVRMLENEMNVSVDTEYTDGFNDVLSEKYYSQYLIKAKALGIASGYEGNIFKPDNTISRQDMFTFTERALNKLGQVEDNSEFDIYSFYSDAGSISNYAIPSIRNLTAAGIISGSDNLIRPLAFARRNEAAQMLYGVINSTVKNNLKGTNANENTTETNNSDIEDTDISIPAAQRISNFRSHISRVNSSSNLESETYGSTTYSYSPENVIDNDVSTCWCEGSGSYGEGEYITIYFDDLYTISELSLMNGLCTNEELYYKNSRLRDIKVVFSDGTSYDVECLDGWNNRNNVFSFGAGIETTSLTIIIQSVYEGNVYSDTCISEISVS